MGQSSHFEKTKQRRFWCIFCNILPIKTIKLVTWCIFGGYLLDCFLLFFPPKFFLSHIFTHFALESLINPKVSAENPFFFLKVQNKHVSKHVVQINGLKHGHPCLVDHNILPLSQYCPLVVRFLISATLTWTGEPAQIFLSVFASSC